MKLKIKKIRKNLNFGFLRRKIELKKQKIKIKSFKKRKTKKGLLYSTIFYISLNIIYESHF